MVIKPVETTVKTFRKLWKPRSLKKVEAVLETFLANGGQCPSYKFENYSVGKS
jgi:hypothetical protein